MAETRAAGTIYDLGYQQYRGARLGRVNAVRNLFTFSFRTAFGLGRGSRSKVIPVIVVSVVMMVALGMIFMASATGRPYDHQLRRASEVHGVLSRAVRRRRRRRSSSSPIASTARCRCTSRGR